MFNAEKDLKMYPRGGGMKFTVVLSYLFTPHSRRGGIPEHRNKYFQTEEIQSCHFCGHTWLGGW